VIRSPVALDGKDKPAGLGRVFGGKVDPVPEAPELRDDRYSLGEKAVLDVNLERIQLRILQRSLAEVAASSSRSLMS
jgi:hypothetical protein